MNDDQTFRIVLIVGALIVFPIMVYHRLRSQATGEKLDRWQEGRFILFTLRPVGVAAMLGLLAFMINPSWMEWSSVRLPAWLRWTGAGLGVAAAGLLIWTVRNLGPNLTDTVVTRREHTLVTSGPYRWVRHPFYDAAGLAILANSLAAANATVSASVVGIEPDAKQLALARSACPASLRRRVSFVQATALALPFRSATFDIAVLAWSL